MTSEAPTVLISDDEPLVVNAIARLARRAGLTLISDTTSERVIELALERRPDLIVLDVNQKVDGRDILARLKQDPRTRDIKVVMLSAQEDQYLRHQCFELGAEDYVVKPFDPVFISRLARMCMKEPTGESVTEPAPPSTVSWTPAPLSSPVTDARRDSAAGG
jgi:two-component system response regulator AdeR